MGDLPRSPTTGEIIRHLRERRGMSRAVLAGLAGYSTDWLKRIERGQRGIALPALLRVARILHIDDLSVLIDGDAPMPISEWEGRRHPAATAVQEIVGVMSFAPATRAEVEPDVADLTRQIVELWNSWHTRLDNRSAVANRLPGLIAELEPATVVLDGPQRRRAHAALASAYSLAQHLAVDITEPEVGRVLVDRAARSAQAADDDIDAELVPSWERRGRLYGEIAAGHLQRRELADALRSLEQSYRTAPETTPYSPLTRGVMVELVRSARGAVKVMAASLAERMGVLPSA